jgi:hypothetical protein
LNVGKVARLDDAVDRHSGYIFAGKRSIVFDVVNACALLGNQTGEVRQAAGPVTDDRRETAQSAIGSKAAFDNAT